MEIVSVAVASISYTDDSVKLINMRNQGAMLGDPSIREGYVQGSVARGMESAGSNAAGATTGFVGMGMGMNAGGGYLNQASQNNQQQCSNRLPHKPTQIIGTVHNAAPLILVNSAAIAGRQNQRAMDQASKMKCSDCGEVIDLANGIPKFCPNCGKPFKGVPVD